MPQASASASSHLLSRRRVALAIPLLGSALWAATAKASTPVLRTQRPVVGTAVDIVVEGADAQQLRSATEHAFARMRELEALLSKYDPQSPVSRVSAAAGKHPVAVPPAVMAVLREAQRIHASDRWGIRRDGGRVEGLALWRGCAARCRRQKKSRGN